MGRKGWQWTTALQTYSLNRFSTWEIIQPYIKIQLFHKTIINILKISLSYQTLLNYLLCEAENQANM